MTTLGSLAAADLARRRSSARRPALAAPSSSRASAPRTRPRRCRPPCRCGSSPSVPSPSTCARASSSRRNQGSIAVRRFSSSTPSAAPQRLEHEVEAVRASRRSSRSSSSSSSAGSSAGRVELARAHRLGEGLAEGAPDRHRLADRLHVGGQPALAAGELLEGEARDLRDDVVDRRLEGRRRRAG